MFKSKFTNLAIFQSLKSKFKGVLSNLTNPAFLKSKFKSGLNNFPNLQKKYIIYFASLVVFFGFYIFIISQFKYYNKLKENNFKSFLNSTEFKDLKEDFIGNLRSPYKEFKYIPDLKNS